MFNQANATSERYKLGFEYLRNMLVLSIAFALLNSGFRKWAALDTYELVGFAIDGALWQFVWVYGVISLFVVLAILFYFMLAMTNIAYNAVDDIVLHIISEKARRVTLFLARVVGTVFIAAPLWVTISNIFIQNYNIMTSSLGIGE